MALPRVPRKTNPELGHFVTMLKNANTDKIKLLLSEATFIQRRNYRDVAIGFFITDADFLKKYDLTSSLVKDFLDGLQDRDLSNIKNLFLMTSFEQKIAFMKIYTLCTFYDSYFLKEKNLFLDLDMPSNVLNFLQISDQSITMQNTNAAIKKFLKDWQEENRIALVAGGLSGIWDLPAEILYMISKKIPGTSVMFTSKYAYEKAIDFQKEQMERYQYKMEHEQGQNSQNSDEAREAKRPRKM